jgi:hypothetical protein
VSAKPVYADDLARGPTPPHAGSFRLVGPGRAAARARLTPPGRATFTEDGDAIAVALDAAHAADLGSVARAIPLASEVEPRVLVVVLPAVEPPSLASRLFAALGGRKGDVPRKLRCSALVARGYVRVGAGVDDETHLDLAWGYAPDAPEA